MMYVVIILASSLFIAHSLSLPLSLSLSISLFLFIAHSFSLSLLSLSLSLSINLFLLIAHSFSLSLNELVSYHDLGNALPADIEHFGASRATQVLVKPVSLQVLGEALSVASQ